MSTSTAPPLNPPATAAPKADTGIQPSRSLGRYFASDSEQQHEIRYLQRPDGSVLVIDYQLDTLGVGRLVARLAPDEPAENAQIVCDLYLADNERRGRCRAVTPEDFNTTHHVTPSPSNANEHRTPGWPQNGAGYVYRIREVRTPGNAAELRWTRSRDPEDEDDEDAVTLREVIGGLEAYEPARTLTRDELARCAERTCCRRLREELDRLTDSPIVLNRRLRHEVQRRVHRGEVSMSEIALRCGRVHYDAHGNASGETSWVARRIGERPESGAQKPRPWIHSDVLALIARDGLGICPREVEL